MRIMRFARPRLGRYLVLLLTVLIFAVLLILDGQTVFFFRLNHVSFLSNAISFGFSAFVSLAFLAVGALVWLFARERRIALLLFCFSFTMMMAFTLQTGTLYGNPLLSVLSNIGAALTLNFFAILLLLFPKNSLTLIHNLDLPCFRKYFQLRLFQIYISVISILAAVSSIEIIIFYLYTSSIHILLFVTVYTYYLIVLTGIVATIVVSYRRTSSRRERQQLRFFTIGVILAFAPLLTLTVFPSLLELIGLPAHYVVNSQISTATVIILPAAIGYSILRYQLLVFDMYIRRVVSWTVGVVFLAVVGYIVAILGELFLSKYPATHTGIVVAGLVILAPIAWWLAYVVTERLFFSEMKHYRRLIEKPNALLRETMDISEVAELLTLAAMETFETQEACLFVFDRESGYFRIAPALQSRDVNDATRIRFAKRLIEAVEPVSVDNHHHTALALERVSWIKAGSLLPRNVELARRPLFLSEALKPEDQQPSGLALYISMEDASNDPLLIAVRAQGQMIGLLALGERGDHQQWAGPDFEVIDLLLSRYSPLLESARLYEQASRHAAILNVLYSANAELERTFQSIDEVVTAYAAVAARAAKSDAEAWLLPAPIRVGDSPGAQVLQRVCHVGKGASLRVQNIPSEEDWRPWYYEGSHPQAWKNLSPDVPSCLAQTPCYPFAWLPLEKGELRYGILALTYARPHKFSEEEKRLWGMFAVQCAAAIENAADDIALRAAYERQKELDVLKDQFIMTASHELRTPLTAVQGYIDLLQNYGDRLTPEARADFIVKAGRGCDELTLMVNNIMDASRVQVEAEQLHLRQLSLRESVTQVMEMVEALARRESRRILLDDAADVLVMGDEQRLKQIILNLVGNAFKYSPPGSPLEISTRVEGEQGLLSIRDYGLGVPPGEQQRLFERFMRLERDMNSPARGAGLGLYICKQLTEAMGGRIWVESTGVEGEGSTFVVALKLYHPAQVTVQ